MFIYYSFDYNPFTKSYRDTFYDIPHSNKQLPHQYMQKVNNQDQLPSL